MMNGTQKASGNGALPRFYSAREVSETWGLSKRQIYRYHAEGKLRGSYIMGTLRFAETDLLALITPAHQKED
jgi:hypothetical protein